MASVPTNPPNARIEPTDKSMPPEMMISVMPSAMMLITVVWRMTVERFGPVKKCGDAIANPTNRATSVANGSRR